jgi:glucan phosphoethanolaminetransferase (alkaline phosphatase superfamily)
LLYITSKTVKFGSSVYQFRNITGFGVGELNKQILVPINIILGLFAFGFLLSSLFRLNELGVLLIIAAIISLIINAVQPDRYGFKLYLNSGDVRMFVTNDINGVKGVVKQLYDFMENQKEGSATINITADKVSGNFIAGDNLGEAKYGN